MENYYQAATAPFLAFFKFWLRAEGAATRPAPFAKVVALAMQWERGRRLKGPGTKL